MNTGRQYPRRRHTRLATTACAEPSVICSLTIATADRLPAFAGTGLASACTDLLIQQAAVYGVTLYAYCLMPDHLHLLASPSPEVSLVEFVRRFKSLSTRVFWKHGHDGHLWQQGFYDHFLRRNEDLNRVIEYILNNPVQAGLVHEPNAYPFSGRSTSSA